MVKILVIDDMEPTLDAIAQMLMRGGYDVMTALGGKKGLELYQKYSPNLVVTDLLMPDIDGLEMIQSLHKRNPRLPIIAISGSQDPVYLHAAQKMGARHGLDKPFRQAELIAKVQESLQD